MLIDLHAHSSGISKCCRIDAPEVLRRAKEVGLDGIVLTNHYQKSYVTDGDVAGFVKSYIDEYHYAKACGEQAGCRVFFGIEVTAERYPNVHLLIYGVDEAFLKTYPTLYDYSLEELYRIVQENDGTLIQAHPFRNGTHVLDVQCLDGIEINCHPLYKVSHSEELTRIAKESGLILTCGGDFHADTYRPHCGTYLPEDIADEPALGAYLRTTDRIELRIHEPNAETWNDVAFSRGSR